MDTDQSPSAGAEYQAGPETGPAAKATAILTEINRVAELKCFPTDHDDPEQVEIYVRGVFDGGELGHYYDPKSREVQELKGKKWNPIAGLVVKDHTIANHILDNNREVSDGGGNISDALLQIRSSPDTKYFPTIDWKIADLKTPEGQQPRDISPDIIAFLEESIAERKKGEKVLIEALWGSSQPEIAVEMAKRLGMSEDLEEITKAPPGLDETTHPKRATALKESLNPTSKQPSTKL